MDLQFADGLTAEVIYDPKTIHGGATSTGPIVITVSNLSTSDHDNLGFYVRQASSVGDVDNPATYPPATDYQDLLTWGTETYRGAQPRGGLIVSFTDADGNAVSQYIRRGVGASYLTRISYGTLASGSSFQVSFELEVPPAVTVRRLFVDVVAE
jgi:hypothetical protein